MVCIFCLMLFNNPALNKNVNSGLTLLPKLLLRNAFCEAPGSQYETRAKEKASLSDKYKTLFYLWIGFLGVTFDICFRSQFLLVLLN